MHLILADKNKELLKACEGIVETFYGDIDTFIGDAIISPANSFGYMRGGFDQYLLDRFNKDGIDIQSAVQSRINTEFYGELPVGQATIVEACDDKVPYIIVSPTMRVPCDISRTVNVYLAYRAAFITAIENELHTVLTPALGCGIGKVSIESFKKQLATALSEIVGQGYKVRSAVRWNNAKNMEINV